jgi:L-asparaginase
MAAMRRRVTILATGGTISSTGVAGNARPSAGAADLLSTIEPLPPDVEVVEVRDVNRVISPALSLADMWDIIGAAQHAAQQGDTDGIVVTHGTATLADTAFLAYLVWHAGTALVFTGAMATASKVVRDGPKNLRDSILAAAEPALADVGPLLVMNGLMHSPRYVRKTHKSSFDAFTSGSYGTFGFVDDDLVQVTGLVGTPPRLPQAPPDPDVVLVKTYAGMSDLLVRAALDHGCTGLVLECLPGRGGVPPALQASLEGAIATGVPVVLCGEAEGRVKGVYAGPAHAAHYLERGAISGGDLSPARCRLLLSLLLGGGSDVDAIRSAFASIAP